MNQSVDLKVYKSMALFRAMISCQEEKFFSFIDTLHIKVSRADYEIPLLKQTFMKYITDQCDENFEHLKEIVLNSKWGHNFISLSDEELREVFNFELWRIRSSEWRGGDG